MKKNELSSQTAKKVTAIKEEADNQFKQFNAYSRGPLFWNNQIKEELSIDLTAIHNAKTT